MGLRANQTYIGTVVEGSKLIESRAKKTPGFQVMLECEDGPADYTIWLTHRNHERARTDFETLGVDPESLRNAAFIKYELPQAIVGKQVEFSTKEEDFKGHVTIKVQYIGPAGTTSEDELASSVAHLFGGPAPVPAPLADGGEEDDIPF